MTANDAQGPAGASAVGLNPMAIAILKWYPAGYAAFPMASDPLAIAFDGANVWVSNYYSNIA